MFELPNIGSKLWRWSSNPRDGSYRLHTPVGEYLLFCSDEGDAKLTFDNYKGRVCKIATFNLFGYMSRSASGTSLTARERVKAVNAVQRFCELDARRRSRDKRAKHAS